MDHQLSQLKTVKSEDGLTYTFTLRQDHYWSDGVNVTAEDYVNGFRKEF